MYCWNQSNTPHCTDSISQLDRAGQLYVPILYVSQSHGSGSMSVVIYAVKFQLTLPAK
jgi:hypothetical protein